MPERSNPADQASRYPTPKTYDQIQADRTQRAESRRPRLVPFKVGAWAALGFAIVLEAFRFGTATFAGAMSQASGEVISSISFVFLVGLAACAAVWYLYSCIDRLVSRVLLSPNFLYVSVVAITSLAVGVVVLLSGFGASPFVADVLTVGVYFFAVYHLTRTAATRALQ